MTKRPLRKEIKYLFTLTLYGSGKTPEAAWKDAVMSFELDPGLYDSVEEIGEIEY